MPSYLTAPSGRKLAYHYSEGKNPGIVFLGGFKSDMDGTKAIYLEEWAKQNGTAFLRLDYSGHGLSSGDFLDGCISEWAEDAKDVIITITSGPQILVGSSMGGWIALLLSQSIPDRISGLVGIAAAPDFTEDSMWANFTDAQHAVLSQEGQVALPSEYSDEPYIITDKLITDGRQNLVLRSPLPLPFPVRLLQGTADDDVDTSVAIRLLDHMDCDDARLNLVKGADHRFSEPYNLGLITDTIQSIQRKTA